MPPTLKANPDVAATRVTENLLVFALALHGACVVPTSWSCRSSGLSTVTMRVSSLDPPLKECSDEGLLRSTGYYWFRISMYPDYVRVHLLTMNANKMNRYVATGDLDGDDDLDVVSGSYSDGRVTWYENTDGAGSFAVGQDIDILTSVASVVATDLDSDGDMDIVVCDFDGGRIVWYENTDGQATFSTAIDIAVDVGVYEVSRLLAFFADMKTATQVMRRIMACC